MLAARLGGSVEGRPSVGRNDLVRSAPSVRLLPSDGPTPFPRGGDPVDGDAPALLGLLGRLDLGPRSETVARLCPRLLDAKSETA